MLPCWQLANMPTQITEPQKSSKAPNKKYITKQIKKQEAINWITKQLKPNPKSNPPFQKMWFGAYFNENPVFYDEV